MSLLSFETKRFVLHTLVEKAASALAVRDIVPALKNFQVVVEGDRIQVAATDLELAVVASTRAVEVRSQGSAVFPGKRFLDLVREAEEGDVAVEVSEDDGLSARVGAGRASWVLRLADPRQYPPLPTVNGTGMHLLDRDRFVEALARVRYAAADDTIRAPLMVVSIARGRMRAADGVRFHQVDLTSWWPSGLDIEIPVGAVDPLLHLLRSSSETKVEVGESPDHIVFRIGQDTYIVSKSAVRFPEIEDLFVRPALENETELRVGRADLIGAIRRMRVAANTETQAVGLELHAQAVEVSCSDGTGNVAREEIPATWDGEDDRQVAFNQHYLTDMLQASEASVCLFLFGDDARRRKSPLLMQEDGQFAILNQVRV